MKREGFVSPVENPTFDRERARKLMEADKARVAEALEREISRIALENSLNMQTGKRESLDDSPY